MNTSRHSGHGTVSLSRRGFLKAGAAGSVMNLLDVAELNHRPEVVTGFRADECAGLLTGFFASRR